MRSTKILDYIRQQPDLIGVDFAAGGGRDAMRQLREARKSVRRWGRHAPVPGVHCRRRLHDLRATATPVSQSN